MAPTLLHSRRLPTAERTELDLELDFTLDALSTADRTKSSSLLGLPLHCPFVSVHSSIDQSHSFVYLKLFIFLCIATKKTQRPGETAELELESAV